MLNYIFEYGASLCDSILVVWFITKFTGKSFNPRNNKIWIPAIVVIFAYTVFSDHFLSGFNILSTAIFLALYIAYSLIVAWDKKARALISSVFFEVALVLLSTVLFSIASIIIKDFGAIMQGEDNVLRYFVLLLHKLSLFSACKIMIALFKDKRDPDIRSGIATASYPLVSVIGVAAAMVISVKANDLSSQIAIFIAAVAFILGNVVFYALVGQTLRLQKEKYDLESVESMMRYERNTYEQASKVWEEARRTRHDMKQHLEHVRDYLSNDDPSGCLHYVESLLPSVEKAPDSVIRSDNKVIDYVLNSKLSGKEDIDLLISGSLGDISDIEEPDLVSILGNVLDNALEALENTDQKELEILFFTQKNNRSIICKNSIPKSVLSDNKTLSSTKKDRLRHGLGTKIVKQEVEKYKGIVDYYEETSSLGNLLFCVQIMIPKK